MSWVQLRSYYSYSTISGLNCLDRCNCNTITGHKTLDPFGPPGPSFPPLIGLDEVGISNWLSSCGLTHLPCLRRGLNQGYQCWRFWGRYHFLVLDSTTKLPFLRCHGWLKAFASLAEGWLRLFLAAGMSSLLALAFLRSCWNHSFYLRESNLYTLPEYLSGGRHWSVPSFVLSMIPSTLVGVEATLTCFAARVHCPMVMRYKEQFWKITL